MNKKEHNNLVKDKIYLHIMDTVEEINNTYPNLIKIINKKYYEWNVITDTSYYKGGIYSDILNPSDTILVEYKLNKEDKYTLILYKGFINKESEELSKFYIMGETKKIKPGDFVTNGNMTTRFNFFDMAFKHLSLITNYYNTTKLNKYKIINIGNEINIDRMWDIKYNKWDIKWEPYNTMNIFQTPKHIIGDISIINNNISDISRTTSIVNKYNHILSNKLYRNILSCNNLNIKIDITSNYYINVLDAFTLPKSIVVNGVIKLIINDRVSTRRTKKNEMVFNSWDDYYNSEILFNILRDVLNDYKRFGVNIGRYSLNMLEKNFEGTKFEDELSDLLFDMDILTNMKIKIHNDFKGMIYGK